MAGITLYHAPRACSRVTMTALEQIGLEFDDHPINFGAGQQKSKEYLAVNTMGKVPALDVDGHIFTENAAILYYLNSCYPDAGLLPKEGIDIAPNEGLQDLVWCSSSLHPMTRQIRMPSRMSTGEIEGIREDGIAKYQAVLRLAEERFAGGRWWYGDMWSIVDVYMFWNFSTSANGGLDLSGCPNISAHAKRVKAWPAFMRMVEREKAAADRMGITLPPEAIF